MLTKTKNIIAILAIGLLTTFAQAVVPDAPGSYIGVTDINCTGVRINFLDNSDNEDGFHIVLRDSDGNLIPPSPVDLAASPGEGEKYVDFVNLDCNKTYTIKVCAYNGDGNSSCIERSFNLHSTFGCPCNGTIPNPPGPYIGVTDINCSTVRINFLDNSDNEDGFIVVGEDGVIYEPIAANDENTDSNVYYNLYNLDCNKTYKIKVLAYNSEGNSSFSDTRVFNIHSTFGVDCANCTNGNNTCTVPATPGPYIGVTDINKTAVKINFLDNSNNETGFLVSGDINKILPANTGSSQVYAILDNLTCNQAYTINVSSFCNTLSSQPTDGRVFNIHTTFGVDCN